MRKIINDLLYWFSCHSSGLVKLKADVRDILWSDLIGDLSYLNKNYIDLAPTYIKNQRGLSNCTFQSWSNNLAIYFGFPVSARYITAKAWQQKWCQKYGFAQSRIGGAVAYKFGVVPETDCPSEDLPWEEYVKVDFDKLDKIAENYKIGLYARCETVRDVLEALDKGYAVTIGRDWTTDNNTGGGFSSPFIFTRSGYDIGGHSTLVKGLNTNYQGQRVTHELNSYGEQWGDKGHFYCPIDNNFQKDINDYGAWIISPVPYTPKEIKLQGYKKTLANLQTNLKGLMNHNKLYDTALMLYRSGVIVSPDNPNTPINERELGCGFALDYIWNHTFSNKVNLGGTTAWLNWVTSSPLWRELSEPKGKCLIISATSQIPVNSPLKHGHIGIMGQYLAPDNSFYIMSNNSDTGKIDVYWTLKKWLVYYTEYGKIPTRYFEYIG